MPKKKIIKKLSPAKAQIDGNMQKLIEDLKRITNANISNKTRAANS